MFLNVVWASNLVDRLASSTFVTEINRILMITWLLSRVNNSIYSVNSPDTVAFDILKYTTASTATVTESFERIWKEKENEWHELLQSPQANRFHNFSKKISWPPEEEHRMRRLEDPLSCTNQCKEWRRRYLNDRIINHLNALNQFTSNVLCFSLCFISSQSHKRARIVKHEKQNITSMD